MSTEIFNPNPTVFAPTKSHRAAQFAKPHSLWLNDEDTDSEREDADESNEVEAIDQDEIFGACGAPSHPVQQADFRPELIRSISDPEHRSMSLEQLAVVSAPQIVFDAKHPDRVTVEFTPTVPHCGMSTFIGAFCHVCPAPLRHSVE